MPAKLRVTHARVEERNVDVLAMEVGQVAVGTWVDLHGAWLRVHDGLVFLNTGATFLDIDSRAKHHPFLHGRLVEAEVIVR
jgi:hypothetical protein